MSKCVLQEWLFDLPYMQQSVLISAVRGPDGFDKDNDTKPLARWFRRSILISAFDDKALNDPYADGGGSFTGPISHAKTLDDTLSDYFSKMDSIPLHYYMHFMHAGEIVGYKHPVKEVREFWNKFYLIAVRKLHLFPETEEQMDSRLGDSISGWKARD